MKTNKWECTKDIEVVDFGGRRLVCKACAIYKSTSYLKELTEYSYIVLGDGSEFKIGSWFKYFKPVFETEEPSEVKPSHYPNSGGNDDWIAFTLKNDVGPLEFNIGKYIIRHRKKNGKEDLLKAQEYLKRLIQSYE